MCRETHGRLGALIESGAAAEMMKAAGVEPNAADAAQAESAGERRDPGTTTIRRPKKAEEADTPAAAEAAEVAAEEAPVDAPSTEDAGAEE